MQAILVRYLGPTNSRGARYEATCEAGSITLPANYGLGHEGNARAAAFALISELGWTPLDDPNRPAYIGTLPSGDYAVVIAYASQKL